MPVIVYVTLLATPDTAAKDTVIVSLPSPSSGLEASAVPLLAVNDKAGFESLAFIV